MAMKLDGWKVEEMREAYAKGESQSSLCRKYGVSIGTGGRVVRGESWQGGEAARERGLAIRPRVAEAPEEILARMLALQEMVSARSGPTSLLDGGDAPTEQGGMAKLLKTTQEMRDEGTL